MSPLPLNLAGPDPDGRDLALYRTRVYRFTDDERHYVLAEVLEERHIAGQEVHESALAFVRACLDEIRTTGKVPPFDTATAVAVGVDVDAELNERAPYRHLLAPRVAVDSVTTIVGVPRSGTSHLYNLLAHTGEFAYFTTVSCWAWPIRNLTRPGHRSFTELGDSVFAVDNKNTRLLPGLVMPYEAEDVFARAMPTYRHLAGHRYELRDAQPAATDLLVAAAAAHLDHFGTDALLTKSPFNSLRIPLLERLWGSKNRYIHVVRDQAGTAESMRRNRFEFEHDGTLLTAEHAWDFFTSAAERTLPPDRHRIVRHDDLIQRPGDVLSTLSAWLTGP